MPGVLKIGDPVMWRGSWGSDAPMEATVTHLEVTERPGEKYGHEVTEVLWTTVSEGRVVVDLDNGHFAYGHQIEKGGEK